MLILGVRDIVFVSIKFRLKMLCDLKGWYVMIGYVLLLVWEFFGGNWEVFVLFLGDIGGIGRWFVLLVWKVFFWIFNKFG